MPRLALLLVSTFWTLTALMFAAPRAQAAIAQVQTTRDASVYVFQNGKPVKVTEIPSGTQLKASAQPKGPWRTVLLPTPVGDAKTGWILERDITLSEGAVSPPPSETRHERPSGRLAEGERRRFHVGIVGELRMFSPKNVMTAVSLENVTNYTIVPMLDFWYGGGSSPWGFGLRGGYFRVKGQSSDAAASYTASGVPLLLSVDYRIARGRVAFSLGPTAGAMVGSSVETTAGSTGSFICILAGAKAGVTIQATQALSFLAEAGYLFNIPLGSPTIGATQLSSTDLSAIQFDLGARLAF